MLAKHLLVRQAIAAARLASVVGDMYGRCYWRKEVARRFAQRHGARA